MKNFKHSYLYPLAIILLTIVGSCTRVIETEVPKIVVNPNDPASFSRYLILPNGATRTVGTPPSPTSGGAGGLSVSNTNNGTVVSSNGSTVALTFNVNGSSNNQPAGYYVRVVGSDMYYTIPADPSNADQFTLPLGIPGASENGQFCVEVWVYDAQNRVSTPVQQCVGVERLGTGALQINLAWNTNNTDIDLHVLDPSGTEIYYSNETSRTGGQLDRDDTDGYGPENIFWRQNAPDGEYKVWVEYYGNYGGGRTRYFVTITTPSGAKSFEGVLQQEGERRDVVTIRKRGDSYSF